MITAWYWMTMMASVLSQPMNEDFDDDDVFFDESPEKNINPESSDFKIPQSSPTLGYLPSMDISKLQIQDFYLELGLIVFFVIYFAIWLQGRSLNKTIAQTWALITLPVWQQQFSHAGVGDSSVLFRDGPSDFVFFASGRENVRFVHARLQLRNRPDLLAHVLDFLGYIAHRQDQLIVDCSFEENQGDEQVFALMSKRVQSKLMKRFDLAQYTKPREKTLIRFPKEQLTLISDNLEMALTVTEDAKLMEWMNQLVAAPGLKNGWIESIIYSDQPIEKPEKIEDYRSGPKKLTMTFNLPAENLIRHEKELKTIVLLSMDFIDAFGGPSGRLSSPTREKIQVLRLFAQSDLKKEAEKERREELQRKKILDKKMKEEEIAKMSADVQKKFYAKEAKKEAKKLQDKRMKKGKVMMT